jgi:hypothetical protein
VDSVRAPDGVRAGLGESEVTDLTGLHQFGDRAGHILDRHIRVNPVLIEAIDHVGLESAQ